jgi:polar amino acid transport system substrate-binding protein
MMMKNSNQRIIRLLLGTAFAGALLTGCSKQESGVPDQRQEHPPITTVYAATGGMPKPFSYVDETGKVVGHNIELIEAVFARLPQYKLQVEVTDFPSIFAGLDADRYQIGVNNFALNEERKQKYIFSDPIFKNRYIVAAAETNAGWRDEVKTLGDLAGKTTLNTVGTNMATAIENYNNAHPEALILQNYGDTDILLSLQMVESGQYDFNLLDKPMFDYYIRDFGLKLTGIELGADVSGALMETPYSYLLVSKGNEKLAADINRVLGELIADGTSRRICEKYFGSDYTP